MAAQAPPTLDTDKAEAFADTLVEALNASGITLMVSIGHRTGLFDTMADMAPATSHAIAEQAGLDERYVREWLSAMVVGGVVEHDPAGAAFALPPEHAAVLTRAATPDNLAALTQWIAVLGAVEDDVVECFRNGGGVPYTSFKRFHHVMAEDSGQTVVGALTGHILPLVPGLSESLARGIDVLDVGCGAGRALCLLAREFSNSRFIGYDLCDEAIAMAREEADRGHLANARFEVRDVSALDESDSYDLITAFDAIHDQADPGAVLRGIAVALRPDGTFLMQDIASSSHLHKNVDHPIGAFLYTISTMHCMTVSLAQGGAGLGTCWGEELATQMLATAGFKSINTHRLPHDVQNIYFVARNPRQ